MNKFKERKEFLDYFNDAQIYAGFIPNQFRDLENFYDQIKAKYPSA